MWADGQGPVNLIQRGTLWEKRRSEKALRLDIFKLPWGFLDVRSCWEVNIFRKVCRLLAAEQCKLLGLCKSPNFSDSVFICQVGILLFPTCLSLKERRSMGWAPPEPWGRHAPPAACLHCLRDKCSHKRPDRNRPGLLRASFVFSQNRPSEMYTSVPHYPGRQHWPEENKHAYQKIKYISLCDRLII